MKNDYIIEYKLRNNKRLFYAPAYNKFWINNLKEELTVEYYNEELTDLRIEITYACNGYCKYCIVYGNKIEKIESLNLREVWNDIKDKDWFKKVKTILLIGGEPLLFFNQIEYLLDDFKGEVRISTNGTLITKYIARKMAEHNVLVYLSLDGPEFDDNVMRIFKDGRYMYKDIIYGLNNLIEANVKYGLFTVATKENVKNVVEVMKKFTEKYHPYRIGYSLPHWTQNNDYEISAVEYRNALSDLFDYRKDLDTEIMQLKWRIKPLWDGKVKKFACSMHTSQRTILADNSCVRCSKIDHDHVYKMLPNEYFSSNCPVSLALNGGNPCSECVALACCGGGCPYDGLKRFGGVVDRRECVITPVIVNKAIQEIVKKVNEDIESVKDGIVPLEFIKRVVSKTNS